MYLIDTNIFLEILLAQDNSSDCENLLINIKQSDKQVYISSFTLHSIEVIMTRNKKIDELSAFLQDILTSRIIRIETDTFDELNILNIMKKLALDFDDALQYYICDKYKLKIISYDKHFDKTSIKRLTPKDVKL